MMIAGRGPCPIASVSKKSFESAGCLCSKAPDGLDIAADEAVQSAGDQIAGVRALPQRFSARGADLSDQRAVSHPAPTETGDCKRRGFRSDVPNAYRPRLPGAATRTTEYLWSARVLHPVVRHTAMDVRRRHE